MDCKKYNELPVEIQKGIDRRYVSSIVLLEETAKTPEEAEELKQIVFERLNSGGEKLKPQETRNALYNGKFNQLYLKLSKNDNFRKMWLIPLESDGEEKIYDSLMQSIANNISQKDKILNHAKEINNTLYDKKYLSDGKKNHPSHVKARIEYFDNLFQKYIN